MNSTDKSNDATEADPQLGGTCCICGGRYEWYGANPWPVMNDGNCCQKCDDEVVIPARKEKEKRELEGNR